MMESKRLSMIIMAKEIKAAIVSGLANADQLLKKIKSGEIHYDFVEVMACRRGCVMGGGQPLDAGAHTREARMRDCIRQMSIPRLRNQMKIRWYSLCMKDF